MKDWSQHGESMALHCLFHQHIAPRSYTAVEFGAGDGYRFSNIRMLMEDGWTGIQWDTDEWVTAENVNDLFARDGVPDDVDIVSIDVDGNDYWIWKALTWEPGVVIIEYNSGWPHGASVTIPYDPEHRWQQDSHHGASLDAMVKLAADKGYFPHVEIGRANLVFVHDRYRGQVQESDLSTVPLPYQRWPMEGTWQAV